MSAARAAAWLLAAPLVLAGAVAVALTALALDLLATPAVALRRRHARWPDDPPASRDASVVVLSYNGARFLAALMPSLEAAVARAPGDHEIIVVDNGSTDGSPELVARDWPRAKLVRLPENRFFIRGNAAGVAAASRDVLVLLNNDMRVEPDFLARLLARFDRGDVFAVTARIEMPAPQTETGRTRAAFRRGAFHLVQTHGPDAPLIPALWAGGGCSAFDRRKYDALGGLEELYEPCYAEDLSLSYPAWRRGWRVLLEPRSVVHHAHRGTSSVVFGRRGIERLDRRNRELFFWRSVTDPAMVCAHALLLPWNVRKDARRTGLAVQLRALAATLPRLPRALLARERARVHYRRGDREVLRLSGSVRAHRRAFGAPPPRPIVLSLGREPPAAPLAIDGAEVRAYTVAAGARERATDGAVRDRVRDLLCEVDHDVVFFRDPWVRAAAPPPWRREGVTDAGALRAAVRALAASGGAHGARR